MTPLKFNTLLEAIREAHRWDIECDLPARATLEQDGSYTLYGAEKVVYDTTKFTYNSSNKLYMCLMTEISNKIPFFPKWKQSPITSGS